MDLMSRTPCLSRGRLQYSINKAFTPDIYAILSYDLGTFNNLLLGFYKLG